MRVGIRLFFSSATFAIVIGVGYWQIAHEIAGTFLLCFLAFALSIIACYMLIAERKAGLHGDRPSAGPGDAAGELIGTYTVRSFLPICCAVAAGCLLIGIIVAPSLIVFALLAFVFAGALLIVQSR